MCEHKPDFSHQKPLQVGDKIASVDECIYDLVRALNDSGMATLASCCGHGNQIGWIPLADGRQILITTFEQAKQFAQSLGVTITGEVIREGSERDGN